jgi:hypothetical protein
MNARPQTGGLLLAEQLRQLLDDGLGPAERR